MTGAVSTIGVSIELEILFPTQKLFEVLIGAGNGFSCQRRSQRIRDGRPQGRKRRRASRREELVEDLVEKGIDEA